MLLDIRQKIYPRPFYINPRQTRRNMAERDFSRGVGEKSAQDCWVLMTRAEKVLVFLLISAVTALIGLSIFIVAHFLREQDCDTPGCIKASYELLKTIDVGADPCLDLHQFVCGNHENIPVYDGRKVDLVADDPRESDSPSLQTTKRFYRACTNRTAVEEDNESTLATLLSQIGGWPLLMGNEWKEDNFNWLRFMADVRPLGIKHDWLFSFEYYEDDESGTNLLMIGPPRLKPSSQQFRADFYAEAIAQLAVKLGTPQPVQTQLDQMLNFENNLFRISANARNKVGESVRVTTVETVNDIWPDVLLFDILNSLGRGYAVFTNKTLIVVASENYIYELHKVLTTASKRTQANYFIWKSIQIYLPFLSDDIRETYAKYYILESRDEHCHHETVRRFHSVIEEEYATKDKSENTLLALTSVGNLIYQSYSKDDDAQVAVVIDGPEGKHSGVTSISFTSNKIVRMINDIQFHIENEFYKCLHKPFERCIKEGYYEDTKQLTITFDPLEKTIYLPYNVVYSESFRWDRPNYINFAKIGRIIGDKVIEAEEEEHNASSDAIGVDLAYEGYRQWSQKYGTDRRLPALNYTAKQLFWMLSVVSFCSSKNDSKRFAEVQNSQHFREDFRCV